MLYFGSARCPRMHHVRTTGFSSGVLARESPMEVHRAILGIRASLQDTMSQDFRVFCGGLGIGPSSDTDCDVNSANPKLGPESEIGY